MSRHAIVEGLPKFENDYLQCEYCIESKMTCLPFKNDRLQAKCVG